MLLHLAVTSVAIVRWNTAQSNVYTCVKLSLRLAIMRSRTKTYVATQSIYLQATFVVFSWQQHLHVTAL